MFKDIKGIIYDGGLPGRAFNGGIFGASCNIGFSNAATKITLSVVAEEVDPTDEVVDPATSKALVIDDSYLNVTDTGAHTIQVGDIIFNNMYLFSYTRNDTPSAKTMTVNFVDQSLCLDKIYVGLTGRHGTQSRNDKFFYGPNDWKQYNPQSQIQITAFSQTYEFRLLCLECNSLRPRKYMRPSVKEPAANITRMSYMAGTGIACGGAPLATYIQVPQGQACINGGYMLLGREGFTDTPCELPGVEYTFDELCDALDWILGGDPNGCIANGGTPDTSKATFKHNLRDFKRSSTYSASYIGTLREVLSAWGADFSFDFSFDYTRPNLWVQGIDLEKPVNLQPIKDAIAIGFGQDSDGGLIRNMTETHSLENTYKQEPLVKYIKPPRPFVRQQKHYEAAVGKVLTLDEAVGNSANLGRSWEELYASIALAKFQPEVRLTWLSDIARHKWTDLKWINPDIYPNPGPQGNGCHACPLWATYNVGGVQTYSNEYECIKDGQGDPTLPLIPNNPSMPGETWHFDVGANQWGQVDARGTNYRLPDDTQKCGWAPYQALGGGAVIKNNSTKPGWQAPTWRTDVPWMALGFFPEKRIIDEALKLKLLEKHEHARIGKRKPFKHPIWDNVCNFDVFIGIWNENFQKKVEEYDKDVADQFLGKYAWWFGNRTTEEEINVGIPPNYGPINPPPSEQQCPKWAFDYEAGAKHRTYMYRFKVDTSPESKVYSGNSYPFIETLKVNDYVFGDNGNVPALLPNGERDTDPCTYCPQRAIFELEDNTWGTPQEVIDDLFSNKYIVNSDFSLPFVDPAGLVPMADISEYVPIYSALRHDKSIIALYTAAGIPHFDRDVYRPEHAVSGYFPGIAFIPKIEGATGISGLPVLEIKYDHWSCPTTTTAAPGGPPAPPPTNFCATGCMPCVCGSTLTAVDNNGVADICDGPGNPVPDCILACWHCTNLAGKSYGHFRSLGAPAGTRYTWGPKDPNCDPTVSTWCPDGSMPHYEPSNAAWVECLNRACAEDYGYCWKNNKKIGYPTPRTINGTPYPQMDKASCEGANGGEWKGSDTALLCVQNGTPWAGLAQSLDVSVKITDDQNMCKCWECYVAGAPATFLYYGSEAEALTWCAETLPPGTSDISVKGTISTNCGGHSGNPLEKACPVGRYLEETEMINAMVYQNTRRRVMEWAHNNAPPKDCTLWCEEDIVNTVCGCDPEVEPVHKFSNYKARVLWVRHLNIQKPIIFPIEHDYVGYWHSDAVEKGYFARKQIVLGEPPSSTSLSETDINTQSKGVMSTRIIDINATQDLDALELGEGASAGKFSEQLVVNNPFNLDAAGNPTPEVVSLPTFYTFMRSVSRSADKSNETIDIKVDGTEFDTLTGFLSPASGLSHFTVTVGSDGIATDLTYVSRPSKLPKRDVLLQKIGPRATEGRIPKPSVDVVLNDWNI